MTCCFASRFGALFGLNSFIIHVGSSREFSRNFGQERLLDAVHSSEDASVAYPKIAKALKDVLHEHVEQGGKAPKLSFSLRLPLGLRLKPATLNRPSQASFSGVTAFQGT